MKIAESTRLKLFQKLNKVYTEAQNEKNGKDAQLEVSAEWKKMKKLKDSDWKLLLIRKFQNLGSSVGSLRYEVWQFISGNANKKHYGGSSLDVDEEEAAVSPVPAENLSQLSLLSDLLTELSQGASTSVEKAKPMPKQDDLRKKIETEKDILFGLYQKLEYGMLPAMDSDELKK